MMVPMHYYPIFIDLTSASCLIVGAGTVGKRKLSSLIAAQAKHILVLDIASPSQDFKNFFNLSNVCFEQRNFQHNDIIGKSLVFAATSNSIVNKAITQHCVLNNVFCNNIDTPREGTFIVPAHIEQGGVSVAISTNGSSPALSRKLSQDISTWLDNKYIRITTFLTRLRPLIVKSSSTEHNTKLFRTLVDSNLTEALNQQDRHQCEHILQTILPKQLQTHITELLHELV